jgi:hypothetical protein
VNTKNSEWHFFMSGFEGSLFSGLHVLDEVDDSAGVTVLVVVPRNNLTFKTIIITVGPFSQHFISCTLRICTIARSSVNLHLLERLTRDKNSILLAPLVGYEMTCMVPGFQFIQQL